MSGDTSSGERLRKRTRNIQGNYTTEFRREKMREPLNSKFNFMRKSSNYNRSNGGSIDENIKNHSVLFGVIKNRNGILYLIISFLFK